MKKNPSDKLEHWKKTALNDVLDRNGRFKVKLNVDERTFEKNHIYEYFICPYSYLGENETSLEFLEKAEKYLTETFGGVYCGQFVSSKLGVFYYKNKTWYQCSFEQVSNGQVSFF